MKEYLIEYKQLVIIALIWFVVGAFMGPVIYLVLPIMLFLMFKKDMHLEILLGFFLILTFSDSRSHLFDFAAQVKNIYIVLLFLFALKVQKFIDIPIKFYQYFIPFFILSFICIAYSPVPFVAFQKTLSYILLFISIPIYTQWVYQEYEDRFFKGIVFVVVALLILGFLIDILNPDFTRLIGRYRGMLGNPNGLGIYVSLFMMLFTTITDFKTDVFSSKEKNSIYIIGFLSLLRCGARTSLFATLLFFFFRKFYKMSPILGFSIFVILALLYQIISTNMEFIILQLGLSEFLRIDTFSNMSGRAVAWEFAWQQIQENFFIGKGFSFTEYIYKINYEYLSMLGHQGAAHNAYLTFWLDTGLIGLILFLVALLALFLKAAKLSRLAIPVLYAILISNNFESWLTASLNPFTIQLLLILTIIFLQSVQHHFKVESMPNFNKFV